MDKAKEKKQTAISITVSSAVEILRLAESETRSFSLMTDILLKEALAARRKMKKTKIK
jgi:hypothetical protein